jgi:hypothetical protein
MGERIGSWNSGSRAKGRSVFKNIQPISTKSKVLATCEQQSKAAREEMKWEVADGGVGGGGV